jgi:hypothetical protein
VAGVTCVADISGLGFKHIRSLGLEQIRCMAAFLTGSFPLWFRRIHVVHHPRFGLVAEDPRGPLSKVWFGFRGSMYGVSSSQVWFGSGGSTWSINSGLVCFRRIQVVPYPKLGLVSEDPCGPSSQFGLVAEDPRGTSSQVWFGSGGTTWFNIPGLVL